jgi:hypothetical protein
VFTKKGTYTVAVRGTGRSHGKSFPIAVRAG